MAGPHSCLAVVVFSDRPIAAPYLEHTVLRASSHAVRGIAKRKRTSEGRAVGPEEKWGAHFTSATGVDFRPPAE